jgi:hypothetical protein
VAELKRNEGGLSDADAEFRQVMAVVYEEASTIGIDVTVD